MSISSDFSTFYTALEQNPDHIETDGEDRWFIASRLKKPLLTLPCLEKKRLHSLITSIVKQLDRLELTPVNFNRVNGQQHLFSEYLGAAKSIKGRVKALSKSKKIEESYSLLRQRTTALKYRIEKVNGGLDEAKISQENVETLERLAVAWKKNYSLYQENLISESEMKQLREASRYPKLVKLLESDSSIRQQFFRWALRDNNSIKAFVQFPSTCCRLKLALLAGRVGRFSRDFQPVVKKGGEKIFRLPFHVNDGSGECVVRQINILDEEAQVTLRGGLCLTVREIFDVFKRKNLDPGTLEFFGSCGITNWHTHELGWWNPDTEDYERIKLSGKNSAWWKQVPIFESLTRKEVCRRYGVDNLQEGQWVVLAKATREYLSLDVDRGHGFFEILIPNDSGDYDLFPLGKFAREFPKSLLEKFFFVTNTVESRIEYPDENPFYSHRQTASAPFVLEREKGVELMEIIRKDLKAAREGNVVFQFAWENCAWWPQDRLEKLLGKGEEGGKVPNLYVTPLLEAKPRLQPLKSIFSFCRMVPPCLKKVVVKVLAFILGSWRGKRVVEGRKVAFKSMHTSHFKNQCMIYHPAALHQRIQTGEIKGTVSMGHHFIPQLKKNH